MSDASDELTTLAQKVGDIAIDSVNIFNPNASNILTGVYCNSYTGNTTEKSNMFMTGLIPVSIGDTFTLTRETECNTHIGARYDADGNAIRSIFKFTDNDDGVTRTYTVSSEKGYKDPTYIRFNFKIDRLNTAMIVKGGVENFPSSYQEYYGGQMLNGNILLASEHKETIKGIADASSSAVEADLNEEITLCVKKADSVNLFNKDSNEIVEGTYCNSYSSATAENDAYGMTHPIAVELDEYITFKSLADFKNVHLGAAYKADGTFVRSIHSSMGTFNDDGSVTVKLNFGYAIYNTFDYIRLNIVLADKDKFIIVRGTDEVYPSEYVEYGKFIENDVYLNSDQIVQIKKETSPLLGKTAIFFGDSICAAETSGTSSAYYKWGWAGRIGNNNGMTWKNYGSSGATIATGTTASTQIVTRFNTKRTEYPNADYIIFEGGTNDADLLGDNGIGTFELRNFDGGYDTTTFTGALEQLFYDAITNYPLKKIGYIVAHKMGHTDVLVARRRTYFDRAVEICKKWGVSYIDLWNGCILNWNFSQYWDSSKTEEESREAGMAYVDGQHLSDEGYDIITPLIEEWMKSL